MRVVLYRYISYADEIDQIISERRVLSTNSATGFRTFYTTVRYDDPLDAQRELALPTPPTHRLGPIPIDDIPDTEMQFRTAIPQFGQPGLGVEIYTYSPVYLSGLWNFPDATWSL